MSDTSTFLKYGVIRQLRSEPFDCPAIQDDTYWQLMSEKRAVDTKFLGLEMTPSELTGISENYQDLANLMNTNATFVSEYVNTTKIDQVASTLSTSRKVCYHAKGSQYVEQTSDLTNPVHQQIDPEQKYKAEPAWWKLWHLSEWNLYAYNKQISLTNLTEFWINLYEIGSMPWVDKSTRQLDILFNLYDKNFNAILLYDFYFIMDSQSSVRIFNLWPELISRP